MTIAICPGSYDPITRGHISIITRASKIFSQVIVAVANNSAKNYLFTDGERLHHAQEALAELPNVSVELVPGLVAEFASEVRKETGAEVVFVKGVRDSQDALNEFSMAAINQKIAEVETLVLPTDAQYAHISSTVVRELARYGVALEEYVTDEVAQGLAEKFSSR